MTPIGSAKRTTNCHGTAAHLHALANAARRACRVRTAIRAVARTSLRRCRRDSASRWTTRGRGTEIGCESSVERKQSAKLGGSHDGISTNTSTRNVTTKPISAAATSQRTLSDIGLHLMRPIIKRAPHGWGQGHGGILLLPFVGQDDQDSSNPELTRPASGSAGGPGKSAHPRAFYLWLCRTGRPSNIVANARNSPAVIGATVSPAMRSFWIDA